MKSSELLKELRENLKDYPIESLKNKANNPIFQDNIYKRLAIYNYKAYNEIYDDKSNYEEFDIEDKVIDKIKKDIDYYFSIYDPYDDEGREFTKNIVLYYALIAKRPIHPYTDNPKDNVYLDSKNETYYCKSRITSIREKNSLCKYCICKNAEFTSFY